MHWKLDETENKSRMRLKLRLNHTGTRHPEAAHTESLSTALKRAAPQPKDAAANPDGPQGGKGEGAAAYVAEELVQMPLLFSRSQAGAIAPEANAAGAVQGGGREEEFDTLSEAAEAQEKDDAAALLDLTPVYSVPASASTPLTASLAS